MPVVQNIVQNIVLAIISKVINKRYGHIRYYNYEHRYGHTLLIIKRYVTDSVTDNINT